MNATHATHADASSFDNETTTVPPQPDVAPHRPPLVLLADSRPLFVHGPGPPLSATFAGYLDTTTPQAAYLGAANGDEPAYYTLFESAMDLAGIAHRRHVTSPPSTDDRAWLADAHLMVLAGGDVRRGWDAFVRHGFDVILRERHEDGALLVGVSAGAIHLGVGHWDSHPAREPSTNEVSARDDPRLTTLGLSHHFFAAHDEARNWHGLRRAVQGAGGFTRGYGLPLGGGLLHHADGTLEPVGPPVLELRLEDEQLVEQWLVCG